MLRGGGASSRSLSEPKPGWAAMAKREAATRRHRSSNPPRPSRPRWAGGADAGGGAVGELSRGQRLGQIAPEATKPGRGVEA